MTSALTTSNYANALAYCNQRKVFRSPLSASRLYIQIPDAAEVMGAGAIGGYSLEATSNNGASWGQLYSTSYTTGTPGITNTTCDMDADGHFHELYVWPDNGWYYYRRAAVTSYTSFAYGSSNAVFSSTQFKAPVLIPHKEGTGWKAHCIGSYKSGSTIGLYWRVATVSSTGTVSMGSQTLIAGQYSTGETMWPVLDFHHNGDGFTTKDGTPHLYLGYTYSNGVRFKKATYSGGSWSWGAERTLDSVGVYDGLISGVFNGTEYAVGYVPSTDSTAVKLALRDSADTTTTVTTAPALGGGTIRAMQIQAEYGGDHNGRIWVFATTTNNGTLKNFYDPETGTWGPWKLAVSFGPMTTHGHHIARTVHKWYHTTVYQFGSTTPYNIYSERQWYWLDVVWVYDGTQWVKVYGSSLRRTH